MDGEEGLRKKLVIHERRLVGVGRLRELGRGVLKCGSHRYRLGGQIADVLVSLHYPHLIGKGKLL